jgi:TetR/AcrR family transcriptional repressor of nem operon
MYKLPTQLQWPGRGLFRKGTMRYPPERRAKTRDVVLKAAARELRKRGFHGIGVDGLSAAAGVTSGAFYSHFSSKADVLGSVIDANLGRPFIEPGDGDLATRRERLRAHLRDYISLAHRDAPAQGCVIPALSADVARSGLAVRTIYQERMVEFIDKIALVVKGPPGAREKRAWSLLSMMAGAMLIARAMADKDQAAKVIDAALESALESVGE